MLNRKTSRTKSTEVPRAIPLDEKGSGLIRLICFGPTVKDIYSLRSLNRGSVLPREVLVSLTINPSGVHCGSSNGNSEPTPGLKVRQLEVHGLL